MTVWGPLQSAVFDDAGTLERVRAQWISGNGLATLGVRPMLGRLLTEADEQLDQKRSVAVLSYGFWMRRFGGNPAVLGRWLTMNRIEFQIVGVTGKNFSGVEPGYLNDLWVPLTTNASARILSIPANDQLRGLRAAQSGNSSRAGAGDSSGDVHQLSPGTGRQHAYLHVTRGHGRRGNAGGACGAVRPHAIERGVGGAGARDVFALAVRTAVMDTGGGGGAGVADRLLERGQPAGGAGGGARPRDGHAGGAGSGPVAAGAAGADGKRPGGGRGVRHRAGIRFVDHAFR